MAVVQGLTSVGNRPGLCTSALTMLLLPALTCPTTAIRQATRLSSRRQSSMNDTPRSGTADNISWPQAASSWRKASSSEQTIRGVARWAGGPSAVVGPVDNESTATAAREACKEARVPGVSGFGTASPCAGRLLWPLLHRVLLLTKRRYCRGNASSSSPAKQNCHRPRVTCRIGKGAIARRKILPNRAEMRTSLQAALRTTRP